MRFTAHKALILLVALFALSPGAASERSAAAVVAFKRHNACPATGLHRGKCPGYQVDHITPLCAGGDDKPSNMQWLSIEAHREKTRGDVRHCRALRNQTSSVVGRGRL